MVRGSNPGGGEIFCTCPDRPWGPPTHLYNGYWFFPRGKERQGLTLTPHSLLVLWSRRGRAIPLLPLWAIWPVLSLSACTRVHFTFYTYKRLLQHISTISHSYHQGALMYKFWWYRGSTTDLSEFINIRHFDALDFESRIKLICVYCRHHRWTL